MLYLDNEALFCNSLGALNSQLPTAYRHLHGNQKHENSLTGSLHIDKIEQQLGEMLFHVMYVLPSAKYCHNAFIDLNLTSSEPRMVSWKIFGANYCYCNLINKVLHNYRAS